MFNYSIIQHSARKQLGLTMNEYVVADMIYHFANNPKNPTHWCHANKQDLGDCLNLSKQTIHTIISKLLVQNLIEKGVDKHQLRTTQRWYDNIITEQEAGSIDNSKESLQDSKESLQNSKESLLPIYNNNNNIYTRKSLLSKELIEETSELCRKKSPKNQCGKCAYCSRAVMTKQQLYQVAVEEKVAMSSVQFTYNSVINQIKSGEFKHKTTYFALKNWINMGKERGTIKEIGGFELEVMKMQYDEAYIGKLKEAEELAVKMGLL